jgi:hypothetical protein
MTLYSAFICWLIFDELIKSRLIRSAALPVLRTQAGQMGAQHRSAAFILLKVWPLFRFDSADTLCLAQIEFGEFP